jgi:hypothetical protein
MMDSLEALPEVSVPWLLFSYGKIRCEAGEDFKLQTGDRCCLAGFEVLPLLLQLNMALELRAHFEPGGEAFQPIHIIDLSLLGIAQDLSRQGTKEYCFTEKPEKVVS